MIIKVGIVARIRLPISITLEQDLELVLFLSSHKTDQNTNREALGLHVTHLHL